MEAIQKRKAAASKARRSNRPQAAGDDPLAVPGTLKPYLAPWMQFTTRPGWLTRSDVVNFCRTAKALQDAAGGDVVVRYDPASLFAGDDGALGFLFDVTLADDLRFLYSNLDARAGDLASQLRASIEHAAECLEANAARLRASAERLGE